MKTQISNNSFNKKKQYNGVYLQQGRMLLDADWNEQVDISKQSSQDSLSDVVGSGLPKKGGVRVNSAGAILKGIMYAGGKRIELKNTIQLLPCLPSLPATQHVVVYADIFEREITALEDDSICDPGLYGADTCTRSKNIVQSRWIKKSDFKKLQSTGGSTCTAGIESDVSNGLFRVEIHSVSYSEKKVTIKWSFENGAEQHAVNSRPKDFISENRVYEFFDTKTENQYGSQFEGCKLLKPKLTRNILDNPDGLSMVRRWDGYAVLQFNQIAGGILKHGKLSSEFYNNEITLDESLGRKIGGHISYNSSEDVLSINLGTLLLDLNLDTAMLYVGDYWQIRLREDLHETGAVVLQDAKPHGYQHHYLALAEKESGKPPAMLTKQSYSFPSLTNIDSTDVAGSVPDTTVAGEIEKLKNKDSSLGNRVSACESDIETLKEKVKQKQERLALWGRGVVAGMIPKKPGAVVRGKLKLSVEDYGGTIIDGLGGLWIDAMAAPYTVNFSKFFRFKSSTMIADVLNEKYDISEVVFNKPIDKIKTFANDPVTIFHILNASADFDISKIAGKEAIFESNDFFEPESLQSFKLPIYICPDDKKLKLRCPAFIDPSKTSDAIFSSSKRISDSLANFSSGMLPLTSNGRFAKSGLEKALNVVAKDVVADKLRAAEFEIAGGVLELAETESSHAGVWAKYSVYPSVLEPNNGQICIGTLIIEGEDISISPEGREQISTSPFMQLAVK